MLDAPSKLGVLLAVLGSLLGLVALGAGALAGWRIREQARDHARAIEREAMETAIALVRGALSAWRDAVRLER